MISRQRLAEVRIVLVRTQYPANIGAAARAMSVMGLSRLTLVRPAPVTHPDVARLARDGQFIVDQAVVTDSLSEALNDCRLAVAFSARMRSDSWPVKGLVDGVREVADDQLPVALVFGPEASGLTSDELRCCSQQWIIPTPGFRSSINLAQAVQIVCYEMAARREDCSSLMRARQEARATHQAVQVCNGHLRDMIAASRFAIGDPDRILNHLKAVLSRAELSENDANILSGLFRHVAARLKEH